MSEVLHFAAMTPGRRFAPLDFEIDAALVGRYEALLGASGDGGSATTGLLSIFARRAYMTDGQMPAGGVMAGLALEWDHRVPPSTPLRFEGQVAQRYERKGRKWVIIESTLRSGDEVLGRAKVTGIWPS